MQLSTVALRMKRRERGIKNKKKIALGRLTTEKLLLELFNLLMRRYCTVFSSIVWLQ